MRLISMRRISLTGDSAWQAEARNELKSCSPISSRAAARMRSMSSGRNTQPHSPASIAGRAADSRTRNAYWRPRAPLRAWKSGSTFCAHCTAMSSGRKRLVPRTHEKISRETGASKCTTWLSACTPASVRPAQTVATTSPRGSPTNSASARSSLSCTVLPSGCDCQPW